MTIPFTRTTAHFNTKAALFVVFAMLILLSSLYVWLINKTVVNAVARERMEREIALTSASIGELEFKYMNLKNSITLDLAYEKGFHDVSPTTFLAREHQGSSLTYSYSR